MPLTVRLGQATLAGTGRNNDYAAAVTPADDLRRSKGVALAIADGVGKGEGGGELAESTVRSFLTGWYASPETWSPARCLEALFADLNRSAREQHRKAACTCTAAILSGRTLHVAHVGDSRAWLVRDGKPLRLTTDHVWDHPDMHAALHRAIGLDDTVLPDIHSWELGQNDLVVLATDVVHKVLDPASILGELEPEAQLDEPCEKIVRTARGMGDPDDATLIVARILSLPGPEESILPLVDVDLPAFPATREGLEVDGFRLVRKLGNGREAQVWLADDRIEERRVVLKIPDAATANHRDSREEFLREEWIGRRVHHPAIVGVLALEAGRRTSLYYAMPWTSGSSLRLHLERRGAMDAFAVRTMFLQLYPALLALHRQGVLHRDIKPDNILRDDLGNHLLADLGVARVDSIREGSGRAPGTPSYMAPELFDGAEADERTEIFSLGVTLYECLTRHLPYGEIEPFSRPKFGRPVPPSRWNPDVPQWLESLVLKAVEPDRNRRFQVLSEFAVSMERQERAGTPDPSSETAKSPNQLLLFWAVVATLLALLEVYFRL